MSLGDIFYIVAVILFVYITFGIVKNYYKNKFDDEGRRMDMLDSEDKDN